MEKVKATKEVAKLLNVKEKTDIDHIKRVRNIDGEKVIFWILIILYRNIFLD